MRLSCKYQKKGLKTTHARTVIYNLLQTNTLPLSVDAINAKLKQKEIKINRSTVFRTINTFAQKNIIRKLEFDEGKFRYELFDLPHHHHLICVKCGKIVQIADCQIDNLEKKFSRLFHFKIIKHKLEFLGICENCY